MLIAFLGAVTRPVLDAGDDARLTLALHKRDRVLDHVVGVGAISPGIDDGVSPVEQNIYARVEVNGCANSAHFAARNIASIERHLRGTAGLGLRARCNVSAVLHGAVAARVAVGGNQKRNLGGFLQTIQQFLNLLGGAAVIAGDADVVTLQDLLGGVIVAGEGIGSEMEEIGEKLTNLLIERHRSQSILHPFNLPLIEVVRSSG